MSEFLHKVRSEYKTVLDMKFWEVYRNKIIGLAGSASTDIEKADPNTDATKLARSQGKLEAFRIVLGLPDKIAEGK